MAHAIVEGSHRVPVAGARIIGPSDKRAKFEVTLKLRRKRTLPELRGRPTVMTTRRALGRRFGASKSDIAKATKVLTKFGLKCVETNLATRTMRVRGTVAQLERAFHTTLFDYDSPIGRYRGRVGSVHVPGEIRKLVQAVFGLDNRRVVRSRRQPVRPGKRLSNAAFRNVWYTSDQLAAHYNFPPGDGAGQTIGLLEFGGGYFPADLKKFCKIASVAMPRVVVVGVDGTSTTKRDGDEGEVMLDIEVVTGACPKASIVVYFAAWTEQGWIAALDTAIQDAKHDLSVVSVSWGNAEDTDMWTKQAITEINESLKEAAYLGVTVCVAAGDDGSSDAVADGQAHVDFPGSSPYVLSIGGTTIRRRGSAAPDIVWKQGDGLRAHNGGSTGGGVSMLRRPAWQSGINVKSVNPGHRKGRCVPDIAANADWIESPYLLVVDGKPQPNGGTSAASPLMAALVTRLNAKRSRAKRLGYLTPLLYQRAHGSRGQTIGQAGCNDVVSGNNTTAKAGGYRAALGYDAASGWGTPNGRKLEAALIRHSKRR